MIRVGDSEFYWREGLTVADLLKGLDDPYPYVVVRVNNRHVTKPDFERATVPDNSEVFLIPMVVGG
jgi:thiamine biosynthesis protein ThiS